MGRKSRLKRERAATEPADPTSKDNAEPTIFKAVEVLTKGIDGSFDAFVKDNPVDPDRISIVGMLSDYRA